MSPDGYAHEDSCPALVAVIGGHAGFSDLTYVCLSDRFLACLKEVFLGYNL